jgi:single-strand DNA-binding protein
MVNRITLFGTLTRNAEAVPTRGKSMTRMRVATHTAWTDAEGTARETTEYHRVVAFGYVADQAALYGAKGRRVYIEGPVRTREFEGADGIRRCVTEIVAQSLRVFTGKSSARPPKAATAEATA